MSWNYYEPLTVDHTKCAGSDTSGYVLHVYGTYTWAKDVAHGGRVDVNATGHAYDCVPYADTTTTTVLAFQRVYHNLTTGEIEYKILLSSALTHSSDYTAVKFYVGNSAISTDQQTPATAWASAIVAASLGDGTTLDLTDYSANADNGTNHSATAAGGVIGKGAAAFSGSSQWLSFTHISAMDAANNLTARIAVKGSGNGQIFTRDDSAGNARVFGIYVAGSGRVGGSIFKAGDTETNIEDTIGATVTDGNAHVVHLTYQYVADGSSVFTLYRDGTAMVTTSSAHGPLQTATTELEVGRRQYSGFPGYYTGSLDDPYLTAATWTADHCLQDANNLLSPSTFYSFGTEGTPTGGGTNATANPSAAAATGAVNAPTVKGDCSVTPSSVSGSGAVHVPTTRGDCTVTPTSISASGAVHAPTVLPSLSVAAPSVAGTATVNAPSVRVDCTVTPSGVAASGAVNAPTVLPSLSVAAPSVAGTAVVNAPTVKGDCTVTLTGVSGTCVVNAPSTRVDCTVTLTGVAGTGAVNSPSVAANGSASVTLSPVSGSAVVNAPSVRVDCTITLAPVSGSATVNVPTIRGDCAVTLTGVAGTATVNSPSITAGGNASVTLSGVAGTAAVHAPSVRVDCAITLGPVNGSATVNAPSVRGDVTISIVGVSASGAVNAPFAQIGAPFGPSFLRNVRLTSPALTSATLTASKLNSVDFDNA